MILFLTLKNPQIFLEFSYLGFMFGIIWYIAKSIINKFYNASKTQQFKEIKEKRKKITIFFYKTFRTLKNCFLTIMKVAIISILALGVWLINFKLNYGYFRISFVLIFLLFCSLGMLFCKTVANLFISFYNKQKGLKNGR